MALRSSILNAHHSNGRPLQHAAPTFAEKRSGAGIRALMGKLGRPCTTEKFAECSTNRNKATKFVFNDKLWPSVRPTGACLGTKNVASVPGTGVVLLKATLTGLKKVRRLEGFMLKEPAVDLACPELFAVVFEQ